MNGAWSRVAGRLHRFLAGSETNANERGEYLTPCDAKGRPRPNAARVYFVHESRSEGLDVVDDGPRSDGELQLFVRVRIADGALFAYDGKTWKVFRFELDRNAGHDWPHHVYMVRHAD